MMISSLKSLPVLKSGVLVELEERTGTVVTEGLMRTVVAVEVAGVGHVDFDEVILNLLILED